MRAPQAGVVSAVTTEQGELAAPGRPIVTLYDPGALHLEVALAEAAVADVALGARAEVELPSLGWRGAAEVTRVHPAADPRSRSVLVELTLPADAPARAGVYGRARFAAGEVERLAVPEAAVLREGQVQRVRVVGEDGRARARHVRTGERLADGLLEVLSGLAPGERIALPGGAEVGR